jgi:hypothetical protein
MSAILAGIVLGFIGWFAVRYLAAGLYTVSMYENFASEVALEFQVKFVNRFNESYWY